jgi:alpha-glucosidase
MDVWTKLKGLSYLGVRNLAAAVRFAVRKAALDRRAPRRAAGPGAPPGALGDWEARPDGLQARFAAPAEASAPYALELRFLAPDLVRVTWQPGALPVPYALVERAWPGAAVTVTEVPVGLELASAALRVTLTRGGALTFAAPDGTVLRTDRPPRRAGSAWESRWALPADVSLHGLGERAAPFDLRGRTLALWNREPKGAYGPQTDPIYLGIPVVVGVSSSGSWLAFYENAFRGGADFSGADAALRFEDGALRYYLAPGPLDRALARYTELTGRAPLPPRWALGFHQSRWSYGTADEVRALVREFRRRGLPLSAVHLDIDYMRGYRVFTVDEARFPDLGALAAEVEREGVRLVPILDPALKVDPDWPLYREAVERGLCCRRPDRDEPVVAPVWPGDAVFPDFTDPAARAWWGQQYAALVDRGAAGVWHDMNEPAAFAAWGDPTLPDTTRHALEGRGGDHREAHNVYALLEARAGFEGLRALRPARRPWLLTRSGWAGIQRYAWTWSGDSESNWWSLAQSVRIALSLGLSGVPYSGPDIGGFGGSPDAELYTRWFQTAAFLPFFRVHSAWFTPPREPWAFGDATLAAAADALAWRERLRPYLYTLAWEARETGAPLVRPLWWPGASEAQRDPALRAVDDAFLLGAALLVAPATAAGARSRTVRLPPGLWHELDGPRTYEGGGVVTLDAPLERLPVLVRAGSVLPLAEDGRLALHVWPPAPGGGGGEDGGALYDDEGDGDGPGRVERYRLTGDGSRLVLERRVEGDLAPRWSGLDVVVRGAPPRAATVDGAQRSVAGGRLNAGAFARVEVTLVTGGGES